MELNQIVRLGAEVIGILTVLWGVLGIVGGIIPASPHPYQTWFLAMGISNVVAGLILSPMGYSFISTRLRVNLSVWTRIILYLLLSVGVFLGVILFAPFPTFG